MEKYFILMALNSFRVISLAELVEREVGNRKKTPKARRQVFGT